MILSSTCVVFVCVVYVMYIVIFLRKYVLLKQNINLKPDYENIRYSKFKNQREKER